MINKIKEVITYSGLSERAFALKCGLKPTTINNQLIGKREISLATISAILSSFEEISSDWLIRDKGPMLLSDIKPDANIERMERLIDTITTLQKALNEQIKANQLQSEQIKKLTGELTMLKNERKVV